MNVQQVRAEQEGAGKAKGASQFQVRKKQQNIYCNFIFYTKFLV